MSALDELIAQIENPVLRDRISTEVKRTIRKKKFGLVFEEHLPECTLLYEVPVKVGSLVARNGDIADLWKVIALEGDIAHCKKMSGDLNESIPLKELVCAVEFGEPIYPYLEPLDEVQNAPESDLWHTLICTCQQKLDTKLKKFDIKT